MDCSSSPSMVYKQQEFAHSSRCNPCCYCVFSIFTPNIRFTGPQSIGIMCVFLLTRIHILVPVHHSSGYLIRMHFFRNCTLANWSFIAHMHNLSRLNNLFRRTSDWVFFNLSQKIVFVYNSSPIWLSSILYVVASNKI